MAGLIAASDELVAAYSAAGDAWQRGPARVYDRMATVLVAASPVDLGGRLVLDVGAGTGSASRAVRAVGGTPVAVDLAHGMLLAASRASIVPSALADVRHLPLRDRSVGAVVASFVFNHVPDPHRALAEAARVVHPGGAVLASAYAAEDHHPVKEAVERAASEHGWAAPGWASQLRIETIPALATVERAGAAVRSSGLGRARVERIDVDFSDLGALDLVEWRLGMAQVAPFVDSLTRSQREALRARAIELLGDHPPLVRTMIVIVAEC